MEHLRLVRRLGRASAIGVLLAGASSLALADPPKRDPRDARIQQLEDEMQQVLAANKKLQADDEALAARAQQLEAEVEQLKQSQTAQTEALQTQAQAQAQAAKAQAQSIQTVEAQIPPPPSVISNIIGGRPVWTSANGRFTVTLHSVVQLDTAAYFQDPVGPISTDLRRSGPALGATASNVDLTHARQLKDGTLFRRARLGVDGTAFGDWDYRILFDFGGPSSGVEDSGQLYETYLQYSGFKPLRLRVGAFPPTMGLDDSTSTNWMPFIERSAIEDMARGFAGGDSRISAQAYGFGDNWLASIALTGRTIGVLNTGTATPTPQTFGDQSGFVGRVSFAPLHGGDWSVHVGAHGSYLIHPANTGGPATNGTTPDSDHVVSFSNTPQLRVDGTKFINTGNIDARHGFTVGSEIDVQKGPLLFQSEYEEFGVQRTDIASNPTFHGWYAYGVWTITGEPRPYNRQTATFDAPIPEHPFDWNAGTWGAWEFGVRYSDADLNYHQGLPGLAPPSDGIRGGEEQNVSIDLNWYPNTLVKVMLDYEHVHIDRLSPNGPIFQTPTGAQIGQTYDALAVRSQFAF